MKKYTFTIISILLCAALRSQSINDSFNTIEKMKFDHTFKIEGKHSEEDLKTLIKEHNYNFTTEHLSFLREFPSLTFEGSKLFRMPGENEIGTTLIHDFLDASDILFIISDETIMVAWENIPKDQIGAYSILTMSLTETEIILVGTEKRNENNIYMYSNISDEVVLICKGIENFINNYLYDE